MTEAIDQVYKTFLIYMSVRPSQSIVGWVTFQDRRQVEVGPGMGNCKRSGTCRENLTVKLADDSIITANGSLIPNMWRLLPNWP